MGKHSKVQKGSDAEEQITAVPMYRNPIAKPMADSKKSKKCLKLITDAAGERCICRGIKEVGKAIRKHQGEGLMVLAGDVFPVDVIAHLPVLCKENDIPYTFIESKYALGEAATTRRPTSVILVKKPTKDKAELYKSFKKCVAALEEKDE
ncbi:Ribosomal protein L7Ae/L8/Nhp2 family [Carpediemonas membranifera]|uniref:H/ACA ribonucleoprotein complex subunit 2 n=1 Tax=Carpediemonas membranifera TaxID=201153 RepID=A0A8J6E050_9EUKA|nr:Ribosomal protein L7Ae/L8/Nhp2 family [Carpediemonas membranifera]|eukprot:KAG9391673.1 Ribosomal protein L7Ae/L8/Nhp2 family [Carpediemonas membranifera]